MLAAGLDGIRNKIEPPASSDFNLYDLSSSERKKLNIEKLPGTLGEALKELKADPVITAALGDHVTNCFIEAKQMEYKAFRCRVTPWEIEQYLSKY